VEIYIENKKNIGICVHMCVGNWRAIYRTTGLVFQFYIS